MIDDMPRIYSNKWYHELGYLEATIVDLEVMIEGIGVDELVASSSVDAIDGKNSGIQELQQASDSGRVHVCCKDVRRSIT